MREVRRAFYDYARSMWLSRNTVLHGDSTNTLQQIRDSEVAELRELHDHSELLPAGDRHYCDRPLSNLLTKSSATRRRWLRHVRQARLRFIKDGQRQTLITSFFRT